MNFGSFFAGGDGPGIGDIMGAFTKMMQGDVSGFIGIADNFLQDEHVTQGAKKITEFIPTIKPGAQIFFYAENVPGNSDTKFTIFERTEISNGTPTVAAIKEVYLSQLTKADLICLLTILFSKNGTATTKQLAAGE
jgi:hypothetical protein